MTAISQKSDVAQNPDVFTTRGKTRPLTNKEMMQRTAALCAATGDPTTPTCSGQVFVGLFFDGTGNNEEDDYRSPKIKVNGEKKEGTAADRKHSNVVRLYQAFPESSRQGTTGYYRYYIPGVGTPFPQIGDSGGMLGSGFAWDGEPRVIWGLIQIFNAVHQYATGADLIPESRAGNISNVLGGFGSPAWQRGMALGDTWQRNLKSAIKGRKPEVEQLNISVFGFSRGAAEARACVNWLFQICEKKDGGYLFAGIPLRVQFMGLLDTVASVGIAGMYSMAEGRQSWADDNMQIHPGVEQCLHFVAGHEVRSCFPSDSVRIGHLYPANTKEYVYPGAHSDVGGGYHPLAQGKSVDLARVPGFDMYLGALAAGVPMIAFGKLEKPIADALRPNEEALKAIRDYFASANIRPGPVEEMLRQHMGCYFSYRWQMTQQVYQQQTFFVRASKSNLFTKDAITLLDTQQALMNVIAGVKRELDSRIDGSFFSRRSDDALLDSPYAFNGSAGRISVLIGAGLTGGSRGAALIDSMQDGVDEMARGVKPSLKKWRQWLSDKNQAEVHDSDAPERDMLTLVDALSEETTSPQTVRFFNDYVHDSMAGFASSDKVNEFLFNGFGIAKFRRIYFGDRGDEVVRKAVEALNKQQVGAAKAKRAQRAQWDLESANFQRANPNPW